MVSLNESIDAETTALVSLRASAVDLTSRLTAKNGEITAKKAVIANVQSQIDGIYSQIYRLNDEIAAHNARMAELARLRDRSSGEDRAMYEFQRLSVKRTRDAKVTTRNNLRTQKNAQITYRTTLEGQLATLQTQRDNISTWLAGTEAAISTRSTRLNGYLEDLGALEYQYERLGGVLEVSEGVVACDVDCLETNISGATAQTAANDAESAALRARNAVIEPKLEASLAKRAEYTAQIDALNAQLEADQDRLEELEDLIAQYPGQSSTDLPMSVFLERNELRDSIEANTIEKQSALASKAVEAAKIDEYRAERNANDDRIAVLAEETAALSLELSRDQGILTDIETHELQRRQSPLGKATDAYYT